MKSWYSREVEVRLPTQWEATVFWNVHRLPGHLDGSRNALLQTTVICSSQQGMHDIATVVRGADTGSRLELIEDEDALRAAMDRVNMREAILRKQFPSKG